MKPELILVANAAHARLFTRATDRDPLVPLEVLEHPDARRKSSDLGDARPGHGSADRNVGGVNFQPRTDPHRKEHMVFARQLADRVDAELNAGRCARLTVLASSPFLGELRDSLSHAAQHALRAAIDIDLTSYGLSELEQRIARALPAA